MKLPAPIQILLAMTALLALGWLTAAGWQGLVRSAFLSSGAEIVLSDPASPARDRLVLVLLTVAVGPLSALLAATARRLTGLCAWPLASICIALLVGENLGLGLRMVALATITLPEALSLQQVPALDLAQATLALWALGGITGAAAVVLGLLLLLGILNQTEGSEADPSMHS